MIRITQHVAILIVMALAAIAPHDANAAQGYYLQRNLITNFRDKYRTRLEPGRKTLRNDLVLNAWGLALRPAGAGWHWWIANTDSGTVVTYVGDTDTTPLFQDALKTVRVEPAPATPDQSSTPTGQVFSGSGEFPCAGASFTGAPIAAPSRFLVVTEDGNLQCWAETGSSQAQRMRSFTIAVNGEDGSVYKGLAITPFSSGNRLYAANFGLRRIDSFDGAYQPILNGAFPRPADVPEDFAPFNIQFLEYGIDEAPRQGLFVAYARTTEDPVEEEQGPGLGYIAEFDLDGRHLRTLHASRRLNAPWGLVVAPEGFGPFSKRLIVGNFGDGTLVAFGLKSGRQRGYLRGRDRQAIQIDGLWGLAFGNGASLGRANYLYFTAGPNGEADGLFGTLHFVDE
ncbi:MAG: TIGR03118 family protein [Pseudomonadota bacterium]|nr:TIGR03118 family protein [Pseudomonadota bacterium]